MNILYIHILQKYLDHLYTSKNLTTDLINITLKNFFAEIMKSTSVEKKCNNS